MTEAASVPFYGIFLPEGLGDAVREVIESGWLSGLNGERVKRFEQEFCSKLGVKYAVAVNSCTSAIRLSYALADVGPGDEVVTTPFTMVATNTAILEQHAKPVFADVQYETGNIDPSSVESRITDKTKAIACVHFAGYPCDLKELYEIDSEHDIVVVEDCAHALGAKYLGDPIGSFSDFACFSFHVAKHFTTGDGGMLVTARKMLYEAAVRRRWFGIDRGRRKPTILGYPEYDILEVGYKMNMNELAAAMGLVQLRHLDHILERRREIARVYREELEGVEGLELFQSSGDRESGNWLFSLHVERRERFATKMGSQGIQVSIVFRRNDVYTVFGGRRNLPNLDRLDRDAICIPLHCGLTDENVKYIVETIKGGW